MSHTYYQLLYHLVWSTKDRHPFITADVQQELYAYMGGIFQSLKCYPILCGGMADHIHYCVEIPPTCFIADVVKIVKMGSSKWLRKHSSHHRNFGWQEGYGVFSISPSCKSAVLKYIKNQEIHHKKRSFEEEFLWLLENHHVKVDKRYLWK